MHPLSPLPPPILLPPMNTTCTDASAAVAMKISAALALVKVERHVVKNKEKSRMKAMRHVCVGIYARAKIAMVGRREAKTTRILLINRSTPLSENSDVPNSDGGCIERHAVSQSDGERGGERTTSFGCCLLSSTYQIDYAHTKPAPWSERIWRTHRLRHRNAKAVPDPSSSNSMASVLDPAKSHPPPQQ